MTVTAQEEGTAVRKPKRWVLQCQLGFAKQMAMGMVVWLKKKRWVYQFPEHN